MIVKKSRQRVSALRRVRQAHGGLKRKPSRRAGSFPARTTAAKKRNASKPEIHPIKSHKPGKSPQGFAPVRAQYYGNDPYYYYDDDPAYFSLPQRYCCRCLTCFYAACVAGVAHALLMACMTFANWGDRSVTFAAMRLRPEYHVFGVSFAEAACYACQSAGYLAACFYFLKGVPGGRTIGLFLLPITLFVIELSCFLKMVAATLLLEEYEFFNVDYLVPFTFRSLDQTTIVAICVAHIVINPVLPLIVFCKLLHS